MTVEDKPGKRHRGRPQAVSTPELLRRGVQAYVLGNHSFEQGMKAAAVAKRIDCPESTFRDRFGTGTGTGTIPGRRDPVRGFFAQLREHVMVASDVPDEERKRFLAKVTVALIPLAPQGARAVLASVPSKKPEAATQDLALLVSGLSDIDDTELRARQVLDILRSCRCHVPPDHIPGPRLQVELDAIKALRSAADEPVPRRQQQVELAPGDARFWATQPRGSFLWRLGADLRLRLPAVEYRQVELVVAALRAEAYARHGAHDEAIRYDEPGWPNACRDELVEASDLGAARGLAERGELARALDVLPHVSMDPLFLATVVQLHHAAIVAHDIVMVAELRHRIQQLWREWERRYCDPMSGKWLEGAPDVDDPAIDEAQALGEEDGGERLRRLSTLLAEQFTSVVWREGYTSWSVPQTVEVLAHELRGAGRTPDADRVVQDLFAIIDWPAVNAVDSGAALPLQDRACCQRLENLLGAPLTDRTGHALRLMRPRPPVDPRLYSTRRFRHSESAKKVGDPSELLEALLAGDVKLDGRSEDTLRKVGWLLDLRAERR